jgi:hypothetical protein
MFEVSNIDFATCKRWKPSGARPAASPTISAVV